MKKITFTQNLPTFKQEFKSDKRWKKKETEHYIFHFFPESVAEREIEYISNRQENAYRKILAYLSLPSPEQKITYYLYPDAHTKKELMGDDWYAQAIWRDFEVHVLYTEDIKPVGEHEDTHLLSLPLGLSIGFFQEGLAEYMIGHGWHGENHDVVAKSAMERGLLPRVAEMMDHSGWQNLDDDHALDYYCFTGSFTKFLIEKFGKEKFMSLYQNTRRDYSKEKNSEIFYNVYDAIPDKAEEKWKEYLQKES